MRLAGGTSRSASAGVVIAVTGVALALMIMEFTLCIVLGFKHQIRDKICGFESEITIGPHYTDSSGTTAESVQLTPQLHKAIHDGIGDPAVSVVLRQPAMLKTPDDFAALILTGHDTAHDFSFERSLITEGVWPDYSMDSCANHIVISAATARQLHIAPGQKIDATFFVNDNIRQRRFTIAGIYSSDIGDYDGTVAFAHIGTLRRIAALDSLSGTGIELSGIALEQVQTASERLYDRLYEDYQWGGSPYLYPVDTVLHKGSMYFNWLSLLDTNVVVIFVLMFCVAGFTLVSSLFLIVLERVPTIGILRAMGSSRGLIRGIFRRMAMRMALLGMVIGNILGLGLMWLQLATGWLKLDPEMYFLRHVPVEFSAVGLIAINVTVAVASWLVLTIPAAAASRIDPARTVRYE